ncbi:MAG: hypothetical protein LBR84_02285, partial [Tannerella sp.]|nr:hypothetical protein [Tannerella sp.]
TQVTGANVHILAGFEGFNKNNITGKGNDNTLFNGGTNLTDLWSLDKGKNKGYGGNITFDYSQYYMSNGGNTEILTPNGNIWGKDSISYHGFDGNLTIDAGLGSVDNKFNIRWTGFSCPGSNEDMLNTQVPFLCDSVHPWRTGNVMLKGGHLTFANDMGAYGNGDAIIRTREGYIDVYDAFTIDSMQGDFYVYAGMDNLATGRNNAFGDISFRDFKYNPTQNSGNIFLGADDNIMLNYGNSNGNYAPYGSATGTPPGFPLNYDIEPEYFKPNPYYSTPWKPNLNDQISYATYDVNTDGYLWYKNPASRRWRNLHRLYRGCYVPSDCSPLAGVCKTSPNGARDLYFDFNKVGGTTTDILSGGVGIVASNYIDFFTKFTFFGGTLNTGLGAVPGTGTLHGESVSGYGLYVKSQFNGVGYNLPEERRATCVECGEKDVYPIGGVAAQSPSTPLPEMTYIGFHDDARIHTQNQKSLLEAPVIEFFGHAEIDTETDKGSRTEIKLKADSLIFHDSAIFAGNKIVLAPYTSSATERNNDMRFGVINDRGASRAYYAKYGPAIEMVDRGTPVLELGYQRCFEPLNLANESPNAYDDPWVGGDIIVTFKYGYKLPMFNTVVANHARISFITDSLDGITGGEYINTFIRTDLLRIRNYVEFYTDPTQPQNRSGKFVLATVQQMDDQMNDPGIYMRHLHMEPGSELSVPGEDSILVIPTTVVGGYGEIHENIRVKADGIVAPGFASLMEGDCQTWYNQGKLTVHNLIMEEGAQLRISISSRNDYPNPVQTDTIKVKDSVFFFGEIGLDVLPEVASLPKGCYLFFEYLDTLGVSKDYVKNLKLNTIQYGDKFFALDFSEVGKVYLCVTEYPVPTIQRWIDIPEVETVFTEPNAGRYFAGGHQDFSFKAYYTSGVPFQVKAKGYYTENVISLDGPESRVELAPSTYQYTIFQIIEPWTVFIGPELSTTANESLNGSRVWAYRNTLYINVPAEDVVSVYNVAGMLNKKLDIKPGINKMTLERGVYVVTLKDGTIHKIVIK